MINKYLFQQTSPGAKKRTTRDRGNDTEQQAAQWLCDQGLKIIARNFRSRLGEIDIIAQDDEYLVFVEVRFRRNTRFGGAAATVDPRKQRKLILTAQYYINSRLRGRVVPPCRFDVIALSADDTDPTIHWYKAAFEQDETNHDAY